METNSVVPLIGALGLVSLAISWHLRESSSLRLAQIGWILVGIYFFVGAWNYQAKGDLILTVMSLLALPLTLSLIHI